MTKKPLIFALIVLLCSPAFAGPGPKVEVKGSNAGWVKIGTVTKNTPFKVWAEGIVDFGCRAGGCKDAPGAGMTGDAQRLKDKLSGKNLATLIKNAFDPPARKTLMEILQTHFEPKYEQGGAWIRITDSGGGNPIPTNLWFFWSNIFNKVGGVVFVKTDVTVWAKPHDGGDSPEASKGYGDNKGSYKVWLDTLPNTKVALAVGASELDMVKYTVLVKTGTPKGAGTDANVRIVFYGDKGESSPLKLDNLSNNFKNGATDIFERDISGDVGNIKQIKIYHDNKGSGPGWYLDWVKVTNMASNRTWNFPCNRWLAKDEDDGKIERVLKAQ